MALKPWYNLVTPREDLIAGKPLDASEFAVHLDHVRLGKAPMDYIDPSRFFKRTYLTQNLLEMAAQTVRRLSGITTETSPVFNLTTQFGGGKTHALTLLYHLAKNGESARPFQGVDKILSKSQINILPKAEIAIFVGTEFSSVSGRGETGEPIRKTPWGEMAYQIGKDEGYELFREHDENFIPPAGDDLNKLFDNDKSYLLLFDELLNYVSKHRHYHDLSAQLYNFMQTLTEFVRSRNNIVLAVSIPASELEMNAEDQTDYDRFKKMLDRLGKAMFMSAEKETTEIIRRRLFDWDGTTDDIKKTVNEYVTWMQDHKAQVTVNTNTIRDEFLASYPFHPAVLSLFERKWQTLPRFQQTRGVLRLLALWVSKAYSEGFNKLTKDPLISLGTAPLEDQNFRAAVFGQLGEDRLEAAVTTDIAGKGDSHALRLDSEAIDAVKKTRLHRKCATIIFFESNGGQSIDKLATIPEIKLSVGEPGLDIGLVDSVLQNLLDSCYYLTATNNKFKFSTQENLIKRFTDRRASIQNGTINELVEQEVWKVFDKTTGIDKIRFPERSNQVADRAVLSFVVLHPSKRAKDEETKALIEDIMRNSGQSARTFKSSLIFSVSDDDAGLKEEARKYLAWQEIYEEADELKMEDEQKRIAKISVDRAKKDLTENVWKSYKNLYLLDSKNELQHIDLGLVHSSQGKTLIETYKQKLQQDGIITDEVNPNYLVRNWPPAFVEWSTKNVKDAFYASPQFPRLLNAESIRQSIAKGVSSGFLAYIGKKGNQYEPFFFDMPFSALDVEISDDMFIVKAEEARKHIEPKTLTSLKVIPPNVSIELGKSYSFMAKGYDQHNDEIEVDELNWETTNGTIDAKGKLTANDVEGVYKITVRSGNVTASATVTVNKKQDTQVIPIDTKPPEATPSKPKKMSWSGEIQPNKWTVFYTKVLAKFASNPNLKIKISFELQDDTNLSEQKIEETKTALKELGLDNNI